MTRIKHHYTGSARTGTDPYLETVTVYLVEDLAKVAAIRQWASSQRRVQIMETQSGGLTRYEVAVTDCVSPQSYITGVGLEFEREFGHSVQRKPQE